MNNPLKTETSVGLGLLLARVPIGLFFVLNGWTKLSGGVEAFVNYARPHVPAWAPVDATNSYLHVVPYLEVAIGTMLILGLLTRVAGLIATLMLLSFTIAVTGVKDAKLPFHPNVIYLGISLLLFLVGPGKISLDGLWFSGGRKATARDD